MKEVVGEKANALFQVYKVKILVTLLSLAWHRALGFADHTTCVLDPGYAIYQFCGLKQAT